MKDGAQRVKIQRPQRKLVEPEKEREGSWRRAAAGGSNDGRGTGGGRTGGSGGTGRGTGGSGGHSSGAGTDGGAGDA